MFRSLILLVAVALLAGRAAVAADNRRAQVAAATADALAALEADVLTAPVTPDVNVRQFVDRTRSRDALGRAMRRAEQIGGTRWLDDQTCQVRMELPGAVVADTLVDIAETYPREAGLPADVLRRRVDALREVTFAATGMSTGAADRLRPGPEDVAWQGVPDSAVQAAVADARRSAARELLESVASIELPNSPEKSKLAAIVDDAKVRGALDGWLAAQPVTSVVFQPDREVRVAVAGDGAAFWDALTSAVGDRTDLPFPPPGDARDALRRAVVREVRPTIGRASIPGAATLPVAMVAQEAGEPVEIPGEPPRWVAEQVDARASSRAVDGRLKTARAAENTARDLLRIRVEALPLSPRLTMGEAARRDRRVRTAIDRAVEGARPRKVNYLSDGGAEVIFSLELREVWYRIEDR